MFPSSGITSVPVGPTSGGKVYAFNNLGTTPQLVAPQNNARTQITFDNPGTNDIIVFPSEVQALNSVPASINDTTGSGSISNQALTPTTSALGGGYRVYGNGGTRTISGECTGSWQALAVTGSDNPLTVTDSNL